MALAAAAGGFAVAHEVQSHLQRFEELVAVLERN